MACLCAESFPSTLHCCYVRSAALPSKRFNSLASIIELYSHNRISCATLYYTTVVVLLLLFEFTDCAAHSTPTFAQPYFRSTS